VAPPTRVFISYSHESMEHSARVLELANRLRDDGVDAWVDQYTGSPPEGWPRWTINQISASDYVICVCSATYRKAFEGRDDPERGLGVNAEGYAISQDLYDHGNVSEKYIPIGFADPGYYGTPPWRRDVPMILRAFTEYDIPGQYEEVLERITSRSGSVPALRVRPRLEPVVTNSQGFTGQAEVFNYLRPEAYPAERLAPAEGFFLSRLINAFNPRPNAATSTERPDRDSAMTVWVASRGELQYVLDSARIYNYAIDGAGPLAEVAVPPDAKYRFTFHDRSDVEVALDPALSIGPETRNMASFTVSLAPDKPIYFFGEVWVWIRYHASDGRQGSVVLTSPFEPGKSLAKLIGQDVLVTFPVGHQAVSMVVTPKGLQRGLEIGYEPPVQLELFSQLGRGGTHTLTLPLRWYPGGVDAEQLREMESSRMRCQDIILQRRALHTELSASDRLRELAAKLHQGESWAGDILGGMATDAATDILGARLEDDPSDSAAFHGLCIRHLARRDSKLAAYVISNYERFDRYSGQLQEAAAAMVIAPAGNMIEMFDRLAAMGIVDWPSILAMLHNHLPPDDWDHLLDHVGGPLGGELYVRGTMHDWAGPPPRDALLKYLGEQRYSVILRLMPELVRFKIADVGWKETSNWGGRVSGVTILPGETLDLICNWVSHDITLNLTAEPAAQRYIFEVNAADPIRPTVTVSRMDPPLPGRAGKVMAGDDSAGCDTLRLAG